MRLRSFWLGHDSRHQLIENVEHAGGGRADEHGENYTLPQMRRERFLDVAAGSRSELGDLRLIFVVELRLMSVSNCKEAYYSTTETLDGYLMDSTA